MHIYVQTSTYSVNWYVNTDQYPYQSSENLLLFWYPDDQPRSASVDNASYHCLMRDYRCNHFGSPKNKPRFLK